MKLTLGSLLIISCFFMSCKKETEQKYCWQMIDALGNKLDSVCNKTEAELIACVNDKTCGLYGFSGNVTACNYYRLDEPKQCWLINGIYYGDITEGEANIFARCFSNVTTPVKTTCLTCEWWYHREKSTHRPTNVIRYEKVQQERFCGDTITTLFTGREIIIKNTIDSLVVIQFSKNGIF